MTVRNKILLAAVRIIVLLTFTSNVFGYTLSNIPINKTALFIPKNIGNIVEEYRNPQSKIKIICIKDLHCNKEVQKNIFSIIEHIKTNAKNNLQMIGVEGAWNEIDTLSIFCFTDNCSLITVLGSANCKNLINFISFLIKYQINQAKFIQT